ncbi:MAG: hypothetical protein L3J19_02125 [Sulfurimonas sp.]|nr:hypothetical protein [Sulfurimonas sp.]
MKSVIVNKLTVVWLVLAAFVGVLHHHNDLKTHVDCSICTIQSNLLNTDVPQTFTLAEIENTFIQICKPQETVYDFSVNSTYSSRAPPRLS